MSVRYVASAFLKVNFVADVYSASPCVLATLCTKMYMTVGLTFILLFYCPIFQTKDTYTLTVRGTDLNGMAGGRSSTGDVVIKLLDINDNIPTLEKEMVRAMQRG